MSVSPLSAFTAVPNPQMLAFMGAQSFIMMYQAGEGWQYGKRKISAMSNEDFNKLTPEIVLQKQAIVLRNSLDTIQKSMNDMTPMIGTIVKQYGDFLREIGAALPETFERAIGGRTGAIPISPGLKALLPGTAGFLGPAIQEALKQTPLSTTVPETSSVVSSYQNPAKIPDKLPVLDVKNMIAKVNVLYDLGNEKWNLAQVLQPMLNNLYNKWVASKGTTHSSAGNPQILQNYSILVDKVLKLRDAARLAIQQMLTIILTAKASGNTIQKPIPSWY